MAERTESKEVGGLKPSLEFLVCDSKRKSFYPKKLQEQ